MKKITFLLSCFILLSAFTCEDEPLDSDIDPAIPSTSNNSDIIGDWDMIEFSATISSSVDMGGETSEIFIVAEGEEFDYVVSFDGVNYTTQGDYIITTTTSVDGVSLGTDTTPYSNVMSSGFYLIDDTVMTIDGSFMEIDGTEFGSGDPQTSNFNLSADGQTLTFIQDEQQTQVEGGFDTVVTITSTTVLQRQ